MNPMGATAMKVPMAGRARRAVLFLLATLLLGGCGALPRITPDMAHGPNAEMQLEGSHGVLTPERSREILDRVRGRVEDDNIFGRHLALESAIVGSPLVAGNQVKLLEDGTQTYDAMFAAIEAARDHVNMETYILEGDEVGQRLAELLIRKQRQGVQVNLIYDSVGTLGTPRAFFDRLAREGIATLEFNPINPLETRKGWDVNQRDHRKLLVVDGRVALLGGVNISSVYSGGSSTPARGEAAQPSNEPALPWRDTDLEVRGPAVAEFQRLFLDTWRRQQGAPLAQRDYFPQPVREGNQVVRAIGGSPEEPFSLIYATLISAIENAERQVLLTNAYFVPDPQLLAVLESAARRGVDVRLLLPSQSDSSLVLHAGRSYYGKLLRAGVKIYERRGALLHAKTVCIDGVWSTVGSTNLDWRSFLHNQELTAVVLGTEFGDRMRQAFERDLAQSDPVSLEQWQQRPLGDRLKEAVARVWAYWL